MKILNDRSRVATIDIVRGFAMVVMVLDHTRDWFGNHDISALDVSQTSPPLFFSRWITHLCAPAFVFLAGVGTFLQDQKEKSSLSIFLISRGAILIVLEQTLLRCFGWYFNFDYHFMNANVLWGIGGSMILLAAFINLPRLAILLVGLTLISIHDLLIQAVNINEGDRGYWLWAMFFKGGNIEYLSAHNFYVSYPIVPWFGIMAFGYGMGQYFSFGGVNKVKLIRWALAFLLTFMLVRLLSGYGNPAPWQHQESNLNSFLSFINLEKYPPSFLFALLMLGIIMLLLAYADSLFRFVQHPLRCFGEAAFFFYVAHIMVVHGLAVIMAWIRFGGAEWLYRGPGIFWSETLPGHPLGYGLSLPWVYGIAIAVTLALYPCCRWYSALKSTQRFKWLKYL